MGVPYLIARRIKRLSRTSFRQLKLVAATVRVISFLFALAWFHCLERFIGTGTRSRFANFIVNDRTRVQFNYRNGAMYLVVTIRMGVAYGNRGEEYVFSKTINNPLQ